MKSLTKFTLFATLIIAIVVTTFIYVCITGLKEEKNSQYRPSGEINIVQIDSCEYIIWRKSYSGNITHKQNCKFCIKRNTQ